MKIKCITTVFLMGLFFLQAQLPAYNAFQDAEVLVNIKDIQLYEKVKDQISLSPDELEDLNNLILFVKAPWKYEKSRETINIGILNVVAERLNDRIDEKNIELQKVGQYKINQAALIKQLNAEISTLNQLHSSLPTQPTGLTPVEYKNRPFQSALIDAVGTLIAERFKEDATTLFLMKFQSKLKDAKVAKYAAVLFPHTYRLASNIKMAEFSSLGREWKEAFTKDLDNIPENLLKLVDLYYSESRGAKKSDVLPYLTFTFDVAVRIIHGDHLVDVVNYLDINYKYFVQAMKDKDSDFVSIYSSIHLLNLIQENMRNLKNENSPSGDTGYWVSAKQLNALISSTHGVDYFLALIYIQDRSFFDNAKLTARLEDTGTFMQQCILPSSQLLQNISNMDRKTVFTPQDKATYMQLTLDLFLQNYKLLKNQDDKVLKAVHIANQALDIYKSIYIKDYSHIISKAFTILEEIAGRNSKMGQMMDTLRAYAVVIESIAASRDPGEIKAIISNAIMLSPVTYLQKRFAPFSLTISAHPGLLAGMERLTDTTNKKWGFTAGFTAPIGLELCWGLKKNKKLNGSSIGLFFTVFDLGAVTAYRFTKEGEKSEEEGEYPGLPDKLTLKQVFAPGLSLNYGIKKSPVTLGAGIQYTPELRKITEDGEVLRESKSYRFFFRISWDLPLFSITPRFKTY